MVILKFLPVLPASIIISLSGFIPTCCFHIKRTSKIRKIAESATEIILSKILKKRRNKYGSESYIVFNYKAPYTHVFILFSILIQLISIAMIQFWDTFLLSETFGCTPNGFACCYSLNTTFNQPLDCHNKSYLKENNINSIICYRYVFRLGAATGSALGTVTTTGILLLVITWILLKCSKGANRTVSRGWCTAITQVIMILTTLAVTGILIYLELTTHLLTPSSTINAFGKVYPTGATICLYIYGFQWWLFEKIADDNECDQTP